MASFQGEMYYTVDHPHGRDQGFPKAWALDQKHHHHLGTCETCNFPGLIPREILGMGPRNLCFNKPSPGDSEAYQGLRTAVEGSAFWGLGSRAYRF